MKAVDFSRIRWVLGVAFISGCCWALLAGPVFFFPLRKADWALQDAICRSLPRASTGGGLVFVALDEGAFNLSHLLPEEIEESRALRMMSQDFPWSRAVYAELFERLMEAGAACVVVDIHFALPGKDDAELREVMARYPGKIILGSVLDYRREVDGSRSVSDTPPAATLLGGEEEERVGFVNFWPDVDGVVRSAYYTMTLSGAKDLEGREGERVFDSLAAATLRAVGEGEKIPEGGEAKRLRFVGEEEIVRVPVWQVFVPDFWRTNLRGGEVFAGKVVLVGAEAARLHDFLRTPVSDMMPGPMLHLNAISGAMRGDFLREAPDWVGMGVTVLVSLLVGMVFFRRGRPMVLLLGMGGVGLCFLGVAVGLLFWGGVLIPLLPPMGAGLMAGGWVFAGDFAEVRREKLRVRRVLERYVSRDIVEEVLDNPASFLEQMGGVRKEITVLFSDLRGFTALTERMSPGELVAQLNEYLSRMVEIVFRNGGTVDKFIGDAVMAVWGTVRSGGVEEDGRAAVRAAAEMVAALEELGEGWEKEGQQRLSLGIGIHSGAAVFGNMGSEQKMEPTVIGDAVNLASRVEGLCKHYGASLVFTEATRGCLGEGVEVLCLDWVRVAGRKEPVEIFSLPGMVKESSFAEGEVGKFNEGVEAYRKGEIGKAGRIFAGLMEGKGGHGLSEMYLERCRSLGVERADAGWSAVFVYDKK